MTTTLPRSPAEALETVGVVLTGVSALIELTDAEPRAQVWVGLAAGAAFLLAIPLVRGPEARSLTVRSRLILGAGVAAVLAVFGLWQATGHAQARVLFLLVPALLLFVAAGLGIREAARSRAALARARLRARLDGQEIERRRWARELHDETLQDLAAIEVRLASLAAREPDPATLAAGLADTRVMVREQIRTLRHLILQMRPLALDTLGLAAALQDLAERAEEASGIDVHCDLTDLAAALPPDEEVSIYRIVQEAVTNALKHSAGHRITVTAWSAGGALRVTVADDGVGLTDATSTAGPPTSVGVGRLGMLERAEAIDASLTWERLPGGGTRVVLDRPGTRPAVNP